MKNMLIGLFTGFISGMFSSGGGLVLVPIFTYFFNMEDKNARATTLFCILPMVITTAFIYSNNSYMEWNLGIKCAIGGIIGGLIGGNVLNKISPKYLKIIYIFFLFYAGIRMIFF